MTYENLLFSLNTVTAPIQILQAMPLVTSQRKKLFLFFHSSSDTSHSYKMIVYFLLHLIFLLFESVS